MARALSLHALARQGAVKTCVNDICTSDCCRYMLMPLFGEDHASWAKAHGLRVFRIRNTRQYRALLPQECEALDACGRCTLHGTEKRPRLCGEFWCSLMPDMEEL